MLIKPVLEQLESRNMPSSLNFVGPTSAIFQVGQNSNFQFRVNTPGPTLFFPSDGIPNGLSLNNNGLLHGFPKKPGKYDFLVAAVNKEGTAVDHFSLVIKNLFSVSTRMFF